MNLHETESTLVVWSERPENIGIQLATIETIAGYRLLYRCDVKIHDLYFDTARRELGTIQASLRIRETNSRTLITLKGAPRPTDSASVQRYEFEEPWSEKALFRIVNDCNEMLSYKALERPEESVDVRVSDPVSTLSELGLQLIQDRSTYRRPRDIVRSAHTTSLVLAELVIDHVVFHFDGLKIHHHEVEIEEKRAGSSEVVYHTNAALIEAFEDSLRPCYYSKLQIGEAIRALMEEDNFERFIDTENNLNSDAYTTINRRLSL